MPIIYYIRHGETDYNAEARLQGRRDTLLNTHGRLQAADAAGILRDLFVRDHRRVADFDYVASPLKRARETMEIAYGDWEGMTLLEIEARMPEELERRDRDKWDFSPPGGGESYRQLAARIVDWYRSVTRDTLVAAHGGGVRALMAIFKVMSEEEATRAQIAQGVVYVFADGTMARYA